MLTEFGVEYRTALRPSQPTSERELVTNRHQHNRQTRPQHPIRKLARHMAADIDSGNDPINKNPNKCQSIFPMLACPNPATRVSGTACAISVPTNRRVARNGYRINNATVPSAPAPMDVSATMVPRTAPVTTVSAFRFRGLM
ncbi:hypothetical protein Ddc_23232 [Ditylenchus destructor]|nr:hypothetical protein Ddc_23232 [Ditylenchus destructor]